jgi:type II secretory pathway pseudopilin PulG
VSPSTNLLSSLTFSIPSNRKVKGYSLVELLVAIGLFSVMMPLLFAGFIASRDGKPQQKNRVQAALLTQEAVEAVRVVRERGWEEFALDGAFHPMVDEIEGTWILSPGIETIGDFSRQIIIEPVLRNDQGDIVLFGGTPDPSSKKVTVEISWNQPLVSSVVSTLYITRYLDNLSFTHTTYEDFEQTGHIADSVIIVADPTIEDPDNAIVRLSPWGSGRGNWCEPNPTFLELDLPGQAQASGVMVYFNDALNRTEIFSTTGKNASGQPLSFVTMSSDYPPQIALAGTFSSSPQIKANSVFGIPGYAFLTTTRPGSEVVIIDLTSMSQVGYYDAPGSVEGNDVFVKDGVGYLIQGSNLRLFDASSPIGQRSSLGTVSLAGNGSKVQVVGQYAYVAVNSTSTQLQIINVSNPVSPSVVKSFGVNGQGGKGLYVSESGDKVYLVTARSTTQDEFFLIDASDPAKSNLSVISSRSTGNMNPNAVSTVMNGYRVIVVGEGGDEYQVWSMTNERNPVLCGSLGSLGGVSDLDTVVKANGDAYAIITTGQANSELKVIEGGPGGSSATSGWYESAAFDAGTVTAFNRFMIDDHAPESTTARYQLAVANPSDGDCTSSEYMFVGPDTTPDSYFTEGGAVPYLNNGQGYKNPGQCFKYRVYFDREAIDLAPYLNSITVNYSP